jgi:hypothetical protein
MLTRNINIPSDRIRDTAARALERVLPEAAADISQIG